jgi:hypothetical protein
MASALSADSKDLSQASDLLARTPAWFEPTSDGAAFMARSNDGLVRVDNNSFTFFRGGKAAKLSWFASSHDTLSGEGLQHAFSSYHVGDRSQWRTHVPHFDAVRAGHVYPGVDAIYYWTGKQFEFDLHVAPGADPTSIALQSNETPRLDRDGTLLAGDLRLKAPVAYQEIGGKRVAVASKYRLNGSKVGFDIGEYDRSRELVIDPVVFVGFFGGNEYGRANAIASTTGGIVYVVGVASSNTQVPLSTSEDLTNLPAGQGDAFVARFDPGPNGSMLLSFYTFWGGAAVDEAKAVVARDDGFVYFAGSTGSYDFPIFGNRIQDPLGGDVDAFLTIFKFNDPDNIWFSAYYGGAGTETLDALAVDGDGAAYIGGSTNSQTIPGYDTSLQCCNRGGLEGWMAKIDLYSGSPLQYGTFIGGTATDVVTGIALDAARNVYLTGYTASSDFPVTIENGTRRRNDYDLFVVKLDLNRSGLDALVEGFYIYGNSIDILNSATISSGRLWIAGYTTSNNLPATQSGYRNTFSGQADGFVLALDYSKPVPYPVTWGTYLGGTGTDVINGITVSPSGLVAAAGYTTSDNFPIRDSEAQPALHAGVPGAFLTVFDPTRTGDNALRLSRVVSGSVFDSASAVAADGANAFYVTGTSRSVDLPITDGLSRHIGGGADQTFLFRALLPTN